jgi:hypothetical protein
MRWRGRRVDARRAVQQAWPESSRKALGGARVHLCTRVRMSTVASAAAAACAKFSYVRGLNGAATEAWRARHAFRSERLEHSLRGLVSATALAEPKLVPRTGPAPTPRPPVPTAKCACLT